MNRDELYKRVRRLIFASPALSGAFLSGDYRSVFKGKGLDFDSLREYEEGDDARLIDWNVTVRLGKPYVRSYIEDRSLNLFLLLDVSDSMDMGSGELSKRDMALLLASLLAYAAQLQGLPVGALVFASSPLRYFEPKRGQRHAMTLINGAIDAADPEADPEGRLKGSDLAAALEMPRRLLKRRGLVIVISDFRAAGWGRNLALLGRAHDTVALCITDRLDEELPRRGSFRLFDSESGKSSLFFLRSQAFREEYRRWGQAERVRVVRACADAAVPLLQVDTEADPGRALLEFFDRRRRGGLKA